MRFERITVEPDKMGGVPCIRGLRIPVATVVGMVAQGMTTDEILEAYPDLEREDVREALEVTAPPPTDCSRAAAASTTRSPLTMGWGSGLSRSSSHPPPTWDRIRGLARG